MTEFRTPTEQHREEVARVLALSLNLPPTWVEYRASSLPLADIRCAFDGDRVVAVAGARDLRQRWGGRELEMCGIWGVATLPEARGSGLASGALGRLLHEAREGGSRSRRCTRRRSARTAGSGSRSPGRTCSTISRWTTSRAAPRDRSS